MFLSFLKVIERETGFHVTFYPLCLVLVIHFHVFVGYCIFSPWFCCLAVSGVYFPMLFIGAQFECGEVLRYIVSWSLACSPDYISRILRDWCFGVSCIFFKQLGHQRTRADHPTATVEIE